MILIFDTETTGLPKRNDAPLTDYDNWPRMVQLAWQLHEGNGRLLAHGAKIIRPDGYEIPYGATKIHGISHEQALREGFFISEILTEFSQIIDKAEILAGHNLQFDLNIIGAEYLRAGMPNPLEGKPVLDTQLESTEYCKLPGGKGGAYKWPSLTELHRILFEKEFDSAHNAIWDVEATARCFFKLADLQVIKSEALELDGNIEGYFAETASLVIPKISEGDEQDKETGAHISIQLPKERDPNAIREADAATSYPFVHLRCHSHYSVLQAYGDVKDFVKKASAEGMIALAITDIANLSGAMYFQNAAGKSKEKIKPIIGMEVNVADDLYDRTRKDNGHPVVLLAKNYTGYKNLCVLSSVAQTDGFYYTPRIDKKILTEHHDGLIAISAHLSGEISYLMLNAGKQPATDALQWWTKHFGDDFYLEVCDHGLEDEKILNEKLLQLHKDSGVQLVATNNVFYIEKKDHELHDIGICVREGEKVSTPVGRERGKRFGLPTQEYYLKSGEEMYRLFSGEMQVALDNTLEIAGKIESYKIEVDTPVIPKFEIPAQFESDAEYLKHLTYEGAKERYGELTEEIQERLRFELDILIEKKFPGYFLIVADFIAKAREMGVRVGPGRGSAAGSLVAYCLKITDVDPIRYDLLFERFLNPERASMPDVDIDFDDKGRDKVLQYVVNKYGADRVAQIITFGTMKAKSAIKDVARVLDLSIAESDALTKLYPKADLKLADILAKDPDKDEKLKEAIAADEKENVHKLKRLAKEETLAGKTLQYAARMEGTLRNYGVHACGVIIAPEPLQNLAPLTRQKESELPITQYDKDMVEPAGLLKMDFLGLKTLSILGDALEIIEKRHRIKIDIDHIPLDDKATYEVFQRGDTSALFQFESPGMQKHLRALKPDRLEDLIAMNALYRPGPLEYIPKFISRKHGEEKIEYDHPLMVETLEPTYGITVYQEQVMRLSQKLAGFSLAEADSLRKAMGKKKKEELDKNYEKFKAGCLKNDIPEATIKKIWKDWEAFASYAFNKSHATCYAYLAYQTAYLKANYPTEFMAAMLNNTDAIDSLKFYMGEAKKIGITVLGPDINESYAKFTVNSKGQIRLGLSAIKNMGEGAADAIIEERDKNGPFKSIFDLCKRVNSRALNKRGLEAMAYAGAFDCFSEIHRAQYFHKSENESGGNAIEKAIKYGTQAQAAEAQAQASLFGGGADVAIPEPKIAKCEEWSLVERLKLEEEYLGLYLSGHPLDNFQVEMEYICKHDLTALADLEAAKGKELAIGGLITKIRIGQTKRGKDFAIVRLDDYKSNFEFAFFGGDFHKHSQYLRQDLAVYMRVKVQFREYPKDSKELECKVIEMRPLSDLRRDRLHELEIKVNVSEINESFMDIMRESLAANKPGWMTLRMKLLDELNKREVSMVSRDLKIDLDEDLLHKLRSSELHFRVK